MRNPEKAADVMDRFADSIAKLADELRGQNDDLDADYGGDQDDAIIDDDAGGHERDDVAGNINQAKGPAEEAMVQVTTGDLWRLVNRSRKMIRLAREGKIPSMEARAPLCRAIKALKQKGVVRKPYNLRD